MPKHIELVDGLSKIDNNQTNRGLLFSDEANDILNVVSAHIEENGDNTYTMGASIKALLDQTKSDYSYRAIKDINLVNTYNVQGDVVGPPSSLWISFDMPLEANETFTVNMSFNNVSTSYTIYTGDDFLKRTLPHPFKLVGQSLIKIEVNSNLDESIHQDRNLNVDGQGYISYTEVENNVETIVKIPIGDTNGHMLISNASSSDSSMNITLGIDSLFFNNNQTLSNFDISYQIDVTVGFEYGGVKYVETGKVYTNLLDRGNNIGVTYIPDVVSGSREVDIVCNSSSDSITGGLNVTLYYSNPSFGFNFNKGYLNNISNRYIKINKIIMSKPTTAQASFKDITLTMSTLIRHNEYSDKTKELANLSIIKHFNRLTPGSTGDVNRITHSNNKVSYKHERVNGLDYSGSSINLANGDISRLSTETIGTNATETTIKNLNTEAIDNLIKHPTLPGDVTVSDLITTATNVGNAMPSVFNPSDNEFIVPFGEETTDRAYLTPDPTLDTDAINVNSLSVQLSNLPVKYGDDVTIGYPNNFLLKQNNNYNYPNGFLYDNGILQLFATASHNGVDYMFPTRTNSSGDRYWEMKFDASNLSFIKFNSSARKLEFGCIKSGIRRETRGVLTNSYSQQFTSNSFNYNSFYHALDSTDLSQIDLRVHKMNSIYSANLIRMGSSMANHSSSTSTPVFLNACEYRSRPFIKGGGHGIRINGKQINLSGFNNHTNVYKKGAGINANGDNDSFSKNFLPKTKFGSLSYPFPLEETYNSCLVIDTNTGVAHHSGSMKGARFATPTSKMNTTATGYLGNGSYDGTPNSIGHGGLVATSEVVDFGPTIPNLLDFSVQINESNCVLHNGLRELYLFGLHVGTGYASANVGFIGSQRIVKGYDILASGSQSWYKASNTVMDIKVMDNSIMLFVKNIGYRILGLEERAYNLVNDSIPITLLQRQEANASSYPNATIRHPGTFPAIMSSSSSVAPGYRPNNTGDIYTDNYLTRQLIEGEITSIGIELRDGTYRITQETNPNNANLNSPTHQYAPFLHSNQVMTPHNFNANQFTKEPSIGARLMGPNGALARFDIDGLSANTDSKFVSSLSRIVNNGYDNNAIGLKPSKSPSMLVLGIEFDFGPIVRTNIFHVFDNIKVLPTNNGFMQVNIRRTPVGIPTNKTFSPDVPRRNIRVNGDSKPFNFSLRELDAYKLLSGPAKNSDRGTIPGLLNHGVVI